MALQRTDFEYSPRHSYMTLSGVRSQQCADENKPALSTSSINATSNRKRRLRLIHTDRSGMLLYPDCVAMDHF